MSDEVQIKAGSEDGTLSTITNETGEYTFRQVTPGMYRVVPDYTGFSFEPPEVSVGNGAVAPNIQANAVDLNDNGCVRKELAEKIVKSDDSARKQLSFALERILEYQKKAKKNLSTSDAKKLKRSLAGASEDLRSVFTAILDQSRLLPKIKLTCKGRSDCRTISYNRTVKRYVKSVENLKRLTFFVLRKSRYALGNNIVISSAMLDRRTRKLYKSARKNIHFLPRKSDSCN